ncbi:MAG: ral secretion pathway protein GspG [Massilia sp.]|nr:ral secretion pathway protein GspG [Massilia sp.]
MRGFTLIELVVTVAIVGLLASIALPMAQVATRRTKEYELQRALREIRAALDAHRRAVEEGRVIQSNDRSGYPPSLQTLVDGAPDTASPDRKARIYFLRRIPRDPLFADPLAPNDATWGKRDYQSSADQPREGEQVFDVYSLAPGTGLNGIPYRDW